MSDSGAMGSESSSTSVSVSSKPWSLTFSSEYKEILIWRNGARLKVKDGNSSGGVTGISILNKQDGIVTVSFYVLAVLGHCMLAESSLAV